MYIVLNHFTNMYILRCNRSWGKCEDIWIEYIYIVYRGGYKISLRGETDVQRKGKSSDISTYIKGGGVPF